MNSPGRMVLMLIVAVIFASCSSTKNAAQRESMVSPFNKVYYRNKVFSKCDKWTENQTVSLPDKAGSVLPSYASHINKPVHTGLYTSNPRSAQQRLKDLVDQLYKTKIPEFPAETDLQALTGNSMGSRSSLLPPDTGKPDLWTSGQLIAVGSVGLIFASLLGFMLVKGIQRGMTAAGFVLISLLLFLGMLYLIITASDAGSLLM